MGLGKTYTGSEKLKELGARVNLIVCQKSKILDWINHMTVHYGGKYFVYDLTNIKDCEFDKFLNYEKIFKEFPHMKIVGVINYDLVFRRPGLQQLKDFTLLLDESSLIQNPKAKRTKFIMSLSPINIILLSGTPTGGKYERLLTQMHLLGWKISETMFWNQYVDWEWNETQDGFWQKRILGYKNEERLKRKMRQHGCNFLKTDEVIDLPEQIEQTIRVSVTSEYRKFHEHSYLEAYDKEFVGDTVLTKMLYERILCGRYNVDKLLAFQDLLRGTEDRLIVFYNFNIELDALINIAEQSEKYISIINGDRKELQAYEECENSITFIQYQAGAMGLNLQLANKMIFFTPPLSSESFEQAKKRIHRVGQSKPCFYYYLVCKGSIEEHIYATLAMRRDYTKALFEESE